MSTPLEQWAESTEIMGVDEAYLFTHEPVAFVFLPPVKKDSRIFWKYQTLSYLWSGEIGGKEKIWGEGKGWELLWWNPAAVLTSKSIAKLGYRGERLIERV